VIEPLLEAERAMSFGLIDQAERLYRQVAERDPKNSIAVVGLARVALERGDDRTAYLEAKRAAAIDPENPAAQGLVRRLAEVMEVRGEELPTVADEQAVAIQPAPSEPATAPGAAPPTRKARRSLADRLLGRNR
jgi:thioredoxin-like negative regulator of GroEL